MTREINLELARSLLDWNRLHLKADAPLSEALIGERFAARFTVEANGRRHEANHQNYLAFLSGFKADIAAIDYTVSHSTADDQTVVLAMQAVVTRLDKRVDRFDAMLLLRFDEAGKVSLWHEVYVQV